MKAQTQRTLRNVHNWFGVLFAPGILFFSFTGIVQTLGLHETDAHPPAWIATIASLHKHQVTSRGPRRVPAPRAAPIAAKPKRDAGHDDAPLTPLKIYVLGLSAVLFSSTLAGIAIALTHRAARRRTWGLLAAGTLVPVLLILL